MNKFDEYNKGRKQKKTCDITIGDKKITLPGYIENKITVKKYTVVLLSNPYPHEWYKSDDLVKRNKIYEVLWELTSGIWCFNHEGTLIWKMPAVFTKDHPVYEGKDTTFYCIGPYYIGFHYDEDKDEVVGQTDYANEVRVKLRTGELVYMSECRKM